MRFSTTALLGLASAASALTPAQWRSQSIYQLLTDRFARADGSTTATCDTGDQVYCGGSWQGVIDKLDYIQGMGFTAVSRSLFRTPDPGLMREYRSGSLPLWKISWAIVRTERRTMGIGRRTSTR
jgi:hypothetical protein